MANYRTVFLESENYGGKGELKCFCSSEGEICIEIKDQGLIDESCIILDVSTAIKFSKTLRTEINKAKEVENE